MTPQVPGDGVLTIDGALDRGTFHLDIAVRVEPGEVLGVLGPNGAGKSSLLRAIAGLTALSSGSIRLGGLVMDDAAADTYVPPEDRPVGLVFQNYRLFPHLTVLDNVAFAGRSRGMRRGASREGAREWIERLDLGSLADSKPAELSGGQAQRVALARALAADPGLLLLDEPLSALDARTRLDVRSELRRHLEQFAGPVVIVTHDALEAMVLADRLLVLEAGRVVQLGRPGEVASRPATPYVASLVGLNLYRGIVGNPEQEGGVVTLDGGGELTVATRPTNTKRVLLAVRPSAVSVHTQLPEHSSPRNVWPGTVASLELLADRVRAQVAGHPTTLVDLTPAAVAELGLRPGSDVWLSVKATEVDVYPETQGTARDGLAE